MAVLSLNNINKTYNGEVVLKDITFSVNKNDKIAIIGDNGTGKTTLLKIINKQIESDSGFIYYEDLDSIGYLSQEVISNGDNTLIEEMELAFSNLKKIEKDMEICLEKINLNHNNEDINRYSSMEEKYTLLGGYEYKYKIESLLNKFGFNKDFYNRKLKTFSGGEKTRASLVKLLLKNPSLLLLDEPTNHLDLIMIEWLEKYLNSYSGTIIIVTHDQVFIDNIATKVLEIENHQATLYPGNYSYYSKEKVLRYQQQLKQFNLQEKEIKRYEMLIAKFKPKPTKTSFAQSLEKKLAKMEKIEKPKDRKKTIKATFKSTLTQHVIMHKIDNLVFGYNNIPLAEPLSLDIYNGDKITIMGQNGSGKTTLLQCLMKNSFLLSGKNIPLRDYKYFYFDQNQQILDPEKTLFDTIQDEFPLMDNTQVRTLLGRFLFSDDDVFKLVKNLSGGEKIRLIFAQITLRDYQILFLDEPTNHLDFSTKKVLAEILDDYEGTIIMVSHDRYFINHVANKIVYLQNKKFIIENGNYDDFLNLHTIENNTFNVLLKKQTQEKKNEEKQIKPKSKNNKKEISNLEKEILKLEDKKFELEEKLNNPEANYDWLEYKKIQEEIEQIEEKMQDLLIKLDNLE